MSNSNKYQEVYSQIKSSLDFFRRVDNENEMSKAYIDEYTTGQQKQRDEKISELLSEYVEAYKYKNRSNKWYKGILLGVCMGILITFSIIFVILLLKLSGADRKASIESAIELISVCITFLTLIVGVLTIITKYVFPENEEEYITRIVEIIQRNDLENKKENIKVKADIQKAKQEKNSFRELADG